MVYRLLLSLIISASVAFGYSDEVKKIKSHYKSLARDFLIYQYIKKRSTSKEDARALKNDVYRMRGKIKYAFRKKLRRHIPSKEPQIDNGKKPSKNIFHDKKRPSLKMTPRNFERMSKYRRKRAYRKMTKYQKRRIRWPKAMMAKDTFKTLSYGDGADYLTVFNSVSYKYKHKVLDKRFSSRFLANIANRRGFDNFVKNIALAKNYKNIPASLARLSPNRKKLSFNGAFYIGLICLQINKPKVAYRFFQRAQRLTKSKTNQNKALFWQYQARKSPSILIKLSKSTDLNIYSLYARKKLNRNDYQIINPKPKVQKAKNFDITDPFLWAETKDKLKNYTYSQLVQKIGYLNTVETLPNYTYLLERASKYTQYYYLTPYEKYLKGVNKKRKLILYSLARQESRFVPASVSTSYALGLLQFMPFLAKDTAKKLDVRGFEYFDMFKPKTALKFANFHLDYLEKNLHNPLFIAYAYNGGIGFTKKLLTKKKLFRKGKYEPFMSMELVHYTESREYGKKVLVNYIEYARLLNMKVDLFQILHDITNPKISDEFRTRL